MDEDSKLTREERDEALHTLYRLRDQWNGSENVPPGALAAVEVLVEKYERERDYPPS